MRDGNVMIVRVLDLKSLYSLKKSRIIAGEGGKYREVNGATILEITGGNTETSLRLLKESAKPRDVMITSFYNIKGDVDAQLNIIRTLAELDVSALIVFYYGHIVQSFDDRVIELCEKFEFPLFVLDYAKTIDVTYENVISEIFEVLNRNDDSHYRKAVSKIWAVWQEDGEVGSALKALAEMSDTEIAVLSAASQNVLASTSSPDDMKAGDGYIHKVNYHNNHINVHILIKSRTKEERVRNWVVSCIKLCIDVYGKQLTRSDDDEIIRRIVKGSMNEDITLFPDEYIIKCWQIIMIEDSARSMVDGLLGYISDYPVRVINGAYNELRIFIIGQKSEYESSPMQVVNDGFTDDSSCKVIEIIGVKKKTEMMWLLKKGVESFDSVFKVYDGRIISKFQLKNYIKCRELMKEPCGTDAAVGMLEPLVEYDADNNGSLLETLEKYMLDCNQDYRNTADCMYIHVNTVQYRVKRALEIIGINYKVSVEMYTLYDSLVIHRLMMIDDQN